MEEQELSAIREDFQTRMSEQEIRRRAALIPAGEPGICEGPCGREVPRLVNGHCGACRDLLGLP